MTKQSTEIAELIRSRRLSVNILGDELFEKAYRKYSHDAIGRVPDGFQFSNNIYLRRNSHKILSDAVHEGTHFIDEFRGLVKVPYIINQRPWEIRAYYQERLFQMKDGGRTEFPTPRSVLDHVYLNYHGS